MIAAAGHFALALALGVALVQFCVPLWGLYRRNGACLAVADPAARALFVIIACAFVLLTVAFLRNDFSLAYVATNSNTLLPVPYRIAAVWGGHEGSLLLWMLMLAGWSAAVALRGASLPADVLATVLAVLGGVSIGFLAFILFTSNPFELLPTVASEGRDLNPLLQDPGLIIHPPMLYMGYVGFSVAFAFAITALLHGRLDAAWLRWTRPWTAAAWMFLTLGIALGSWWAYHELGWGGWWFWDPVENASFMPWLVGTALLHSLAASEKRGVLRSWTVLLAICAFALSLLGTFLVRSGVLVSVHAFATDPSRGVFILAFFSIVVGSSLLLFAWRGHRIAAPVAFAMFSREGLLLLNNVLLVVAALTVLLGTLYPLLVDAMGLAKPSVGSPWFNLTFVPIMLPLVALIGVSYLVGWKRGRLQEFRRAVAPALVAVVLGLSLPLLVPGSQSLGVYLALILGGWAITTAVAELVRWLRLSRRPSRAIVGMCLAHFGLGVFTIGVTLVSHADVERDLSMKPGDTVLMSGYDWRLLEVLPVSGPNYDAQRGTIEVSRNGDLVARLYPEKRSYRSQPNNPMTESAVDVGITRDLYVALAEPLGEGAWSVRLYYKPFIRWIWVGALLMAIGGGLAATDRRYRLGRSLARDGLGDDLAATPGALS